MSHDATRHLPAVRSACAELLQAGERVTFPRVAERTGISRATLYRQRELRELIDEHRHPSGEPLTVTALAAQIDQLRDTLDALAAKVRHHEEQLRAAPSGSTPTPSRARR
jgi:predicted DNA-binding transcriptional regulator AlpA